MTRVLWKAPGGFQEVWRHPHLDNLVRLVAAEMDLLGATPLNSAQGSAMVGEVASGVD